MCIGSKLCSLKTSKFSQGPFVGAISLQHYHHRRQLEHSWLQRLTRHCTWPQKGKWHIFPERDRIGSLNLRSFVQLPWSKLPHWAGCQAHHARVLSLCETTPGSQLSRQSNPRRGETQRSLKSFCITHKQDFLVSGSGSQNKKKHQEPRKNGFSYSMHSDPAFPSSNPLETSLKPYPKSDHQL